jgi:hypothetical protein
VLASIGIPAPTSGASEMRPFIVAIAIIAITWSPWRARAQEPVGEAATSVVDDASGAAEDPRDARMRALEERLAQLEASMTTHAQEHADDEGSDTAPTREGTTFPHADDRFADPWANENWRWIPGNYGPRTSSLRAGDVFVGEIRMDGAFHQSFNNPVDHTISGSSEVFRSGEFQLAQIGVGGDFSFDHVHARFMTQFGMYSQTTPRNDPSAARGQWNLDDAYRYISEAYGGVHIDELHGINIQAGIFMSYVGLWSYYNANNWTYQPSYVSSNTPWFFNGVRAQIFVDEHLKIEPWLVNGWQAYGVFNEAPGGGLQVLWRPFEWLSILGNQYVGTDTLGQPHRGRIHTDDSVMVRYHNDPSFFISQAAFSVTVDAGCEFGGQGTDSNGNTVNIACDNQYFYGFMVYNRMWFDQDHFALTVGGGAISNPGRYLVLTPPINGATAYSGSAYFTQNPGDPFEAWDMQLTADYMPFDTLTFRVEFNHRASSVPYFAGAGGVTPNTPMGGVNSGPPGSMVAGWAGPDLRYSEDRLTVAMLVRL